MGGRGTKKKGLKFKGLVPNQGGQWTHGQLGEDHRKSLCEIPR